jgi:nucleoside-diphosphate-sugar epimerase
MKCLIIGGNRFVGLRLSRLLDSTPGVDLSILNRTGQVAHVKKAARYKGDRGNLALTNLDRDWDVIIDFACFTRKDAESSLEYFSKVGRYIFVSTYSIYDLKMGLKECDFSAEQWVLQPPEARPKDEGLAYQFGKRQAEAIFAQKTDFETVSVRFPFILGPDDYTDRFEFHLQRIQARKPIFAEDPKARFSVISSEDAAKFLNWCAREKFTGPINVASPHPISVHDIAAQVLLLQDLNVLWAKNEDAENSSPYSHVPEWSLDVGRMRELGFETKPALDWLGELIGPSTNRSGFVH